MTNNTVSELEEILNEHEKIAKHLEAYDMEIKNREKELEEERRRIYMDLKNREKELEEKRRNIEEAREIDTEKKAAEKALRLAEDRKIENKELRSRIVELQKNLENALTVAGKQKRGEEELCSMIFELQKKLENALRLAGEQKIGEEKLHRRFAELHKKLDSKKALWRKEKGDLNRKVDELQKKLNSKKALKLALKVIREFDEDGQVGLENKMDGAVELKNETNAIHQDMKEKDKHIEHLESLISILTAKELKSNDELQEARKELINGFLDSHAYISVKKMGELDSKPFQTATKRRYVDEAATDGEVTTKRKYDEDETTDEQAVELCSLWESYLRDPSWHPFKVIRMEGDHKEVIDEEDKQLKTLKEQLGNEVYEAVTTALIELNDYNPSGRYPVHELWNFKEERKATVKEGVSHLLKQLNLYKRRNSYKRRRKTRS
ncbi:hypothetical protein RHSIM_Rhsim01G0228900 [Rhododendron simsii]|uniref:Factor of DNA methylation 1-5/IDN2 domain-containing protein n=1 Tax=Rhododendron simsii TaxID=118357 RepID=A0A834LU55_RHOSS|nr:hypothetical protein RHSIM_Rhsim01G0228900 [Rhododendron simsii]